jgi:hypothetical protein
MHSHGIKMSERGQCRDKMVARLFENVVLQEEINFLRWRGSFHFQEEEF